MEHKFNTKFSVGDVLYTLINKKITKVVINNIEAIINITYCDSPVVNIKYSLVLHDHTRRYLGYGYEQDLYKTKEELINNL